MVYISSVKTAAASWMLRFALPACKWRFWFQDVVRKDRKKGHVMCSPIRRGAGGEENAELECGGVGHQGLAHHQVRGASDMQPQASVGLGLAQPGNLSSMDSVQFYSFSG